MEFRNPNEVEQSAPAPKAAFPRNYFSAANDSYLGFRERISADEIVQATCDELSGVWYDDNGEKHQSQEFRFLNEVGVNRVRAILKSFVNKITHLTKFENENRVLLQVKSTIQAFIPELVLNLRPWAPKGKDKIPNWPLIVHMLEKQFLASALRGNAGFEALNVTQQHHILESIDTKKKEGLGGLFSKFRGE